MFHSCAKFIFNCLVDLSLTLHQKTGPVSKYKKTVGNLHVQLESLDKCPACGCLSLGYVQVTSVEVDFTNEINFKDDILT